MSNAAIETLIKERQALLLAKEKMLSEYNASINDIEIAIEQLSGKTVWEAERDYIYDDENPDYIKTSIEEM